MGTTSDALINQHIENAIAAERSFEAQFRGLSQNGDDDEVQGVFTRHAEQIQHQIELLSGRLREVGGTAGAESAFVHSVETAPQVTTPDVVEERIMQNLVVACTIGAVQCAMYEVLAVVARAAGDQITETLAREIQDQKRSYAGKAWHLLPSRSKIAFNMLTVSEVDPAVKTRTLDNRLVQ